MSTIGWLVIGAFGVAAVIAIVIAMSQRSGAAGSFLGGGGGGDSFAGNLVRSIGGAIGSIGGQVADEVERSEQAAEGGGA